MNLILKCSTVVAFSVAFVCAAPDVAHARSRDSDPGGHTNRGVRYARDKEYDKAIAEFTKAIEAQPNDPKNYENRAMAYRLGGKPAQALGDLSKIIETAPERRGRICSQRSDRSRAKEVRFSDQGSDAGDGARPKE